VAALDAVEEGVDLGRQLAEPIERARVSGHGATLRDIVPAMKRSGSAAPADDAPPPQVRRLEGNPAWKGLHAIVVADDGRIFAGERDGHRVAAWDKAGKPLWQATAVAAKGRKNPFWDRRVAVALVGQDLLVLAPVDADDERLYVLDPKTGKPRRTLALAGGAAAFAVVAGRVVYGSSGAAAVSYPAMKPVVPLARCDDGIVSAIVASGRWLAVKAGERIDLFDGKTLKHGRGIGFAVDPSALAIGDDLLVTGDEKARVHLYQARSGKRLAQLDAADGTKAEVRALATSPRWIAASCADGGVVLIDGKTRKVARRLDGHRRAGVDDASLALAFAPDGRTLWVGATTGKTPGLTGYPVEV
jgi:outer membrane protein assembly factor BamB